MTKTVHGLRAWLVQRFTAVYTRGFSLFLLLHFAANTRHSCEAWRDWILETPVQVAAALFFVALLLHAGVGLRDGVPGLSTLRIHKHPQQ